MGITDNMDITWTKCSDRMPPDDLSCGIITIDDLHGICSDDGKCLNSIKDFCIEFNTVWTPYTEEAWKELNKCSQG